MESSERLLGTLGKLYRSKTRYFITALSGSPKCIEVRTAKASRKLCAQRQLSRPIISIEAGQRTVTRAPFLIVDGKKSHRFVVDRYQIKNSINVTTTKNRNMILSFEEPLQSDPKKRILLYRKVLSFTTQIGLQYPVVKQFKSELETAQEKGRRILSHLKE